MRAVYDAVLFDLDGTLSQSHPGILNAVRYALRELGEPVPEESVLRRTIGPPLIHGFSEVCGLSPERAKEAAEVFRQYYDARGVYENELYPHMRELLARLKKAGARLCVASSKSEYAAGLVVRHFGLEDVFDVVSASDMYTKAELIRRALAGCGVSPERAVMIGDTRFDAAAASETGTHFIGMLYGYGSEEEMRQNGGHCFAPDVPALEQLLFCEQALS